MHHLLGFSETQILDLLAMLFHPAKVPSIGFDLLLDSYSAYCGEDINDFAVLYSSIHSLSR